MRGSRDAAGGGHGSCRHYVEVRRRAESSQFSEGSRDRKRKHLIASVQAPSRRELPSLKIPDVQPCSTPTTTLLPASPEPHLSFLERFPLPYTSHPFTRQRLRTPVALSFPFFACLTPPALAFRRVRPLRVGTPVPPLSPTHSSNDSRHGVLGSICQHARGNRRSGLGAQVRPMPAPPFVPMATR